MSWESSESIAAIAISRYVDPLDIPRTGGRTVGRNKFIRQKVTVDVVGTIKGTKGRMFLCDVKQNDAVNKCPVDEDRLPEHQRTALVQHGKNGAIAGLFIESTHRKRFYWCDWGFLVQRVPSIGFDMMLDLGPSSVVPDLGRLVNRDQ